MLAVLLNPITILRGSMTVLLNPTAGVLLAIPCWSLVALLLVCWKSPGGLLMVFWWSPGGLLVISW